MKRVLPKLLKSRDLAYSKALDLRYYSVGAGVFFWFWIALFSPGYAQFVAYTVPVFFVLGFLAELRAELFLRLTLLATVLGFAGLLSVPSQALNIIDQLFALLLSLLYFVGYCVICFYGYGEHRR